MYFVRESKTKITSFFKSYALYCGFKPLLKLFYFFIVCKRSVASFVLNDKAKHNFNRPGNTYYVSRYNELLIYRCNTSL